MTKKCIPDGWTKENLVSCLETVIDYRGKTPKKSETGILTLSAKSVKMGYIDYNQAYYVSKKTFDKFMVRGFPKRGDVLMTTEAPLGCIAKLDRDDICIAQRLLTLRGKKDVLDNDYLKCYLTSRRGQHELTSRASGSTVQGIKRTEFEKVNILLPKFEEQKAIANILSSFDNKIELLQAQNKTLETTAQTIFKEWFGAPKSPKGDLSEGWKEYELGEVAILSAGGDRPKNTTTEKTIDSNIPIYSNGITNDGLYGFTNVPKISEESVTISARGTIGFICLRFSPYVPIVRLIAVIPIQNYLSSKYLFFWLKNQKIDGFGTTQQQLTIPVFKKTKIIIPTSTLMKEYTQQVDSFYNKIQSNNSQIQTLTKTRDTLLPKLMSGELRVNEFSEDCL